MTDIMVGYHNDRLVAVKETDDSARSARLSHEEDLLSRLDHPGVVRIVDLTEGPPAILRTVFVGPDAWLVEPGDNLRAIAETILTERSETTTRSSVAAYWGALLEANADQLVDRDLIMPGQMLTLPLLTTGS